MIPLVDHPSREELAGKLMKKGSLMPGLSGPLKTPAPDWSTPLHILISLWSKSEDVPGQKLETRNSKPELKAES
jgi:hypothetical protein